MIGLPIILLGAPEGILLALLAIFLIGGYLLIRAMLNGTIPDVKIPLIGNLRSLAMSAFDGIISGLRAGWEAAGNSAYWFIVTPVVVAEHMISGAISLGENIAWRLERVVAVDIPGAMNVALKFAQSVETTVVGYIATALATALAAAANVQAWATAYVNMIHVALSNDIIALRNDAANALAAVDGTLTAAITTSLGEAYAFTSKVEAAVENDIAALAGIVAADVLKVEQFATSGIGQALSAAEAYALAQAEAAAAGAISGLEHLTETTVAAIWAGIMTDVENVVAVADQDFQDVVADLRSVARAVPTDIAGAIAATLAISIPLLKLAKDCTMPNCRNLSGFGQFLADLFTDATDVAFVAMLAELVHNPKQGAADVMSELGGLANDTIGLAKELVGV
jgi:hypothetical protein